MKLTEAEKRAKRNADARLNYWADRRLKDVINRRSQLESWTETIVTVQEEKEAKVTKTSKRRIWNVQAEERAA